MIKKHIKKTIFVLGLLLVLIPVIIIVFISPITKYLVEEYDQEYTGREITLDWAYVNPFTGYIHFNDLVINESESDSIFLSAKGLSANFEVWKLLARDYEISDLTLTQPVGIFVQDSIGLNIRDIINKFKPDSLAEPKAPVHFTLARIRVKDGEFHYRDTLTPINYFVKEVNIESSGIYWDADTIAAKFSFVSGMGSGDIAGECTINTKNMDYSISSVVKKYSLDIIQQYLNDLVNYGTFRAYVDADFQATGNFLHADDLDAKGLFEVSDFHFGKDSAEVFAAFDKFTLDIARLSPNNNEYRFDSITLHHPFVKYERYDYLDNIQLMFGEEGSNVSAVNADPEKFNLIIEIAQYVKKLSKNFFASQYQIKHLAIYDGDIRYKDFSLNEEFSVAANPLNVLADSINKKNKRVHFAFNTGIVPYGNASIRLSINPKDSSDFDMTYHFEKIPTSMFNPYLISLTSFPMDRGSIEMSGVWNVRNGNIKSKNSVIVIDPRIGKKIIKENQRKLPMPLIMAFIRELGNVIDYDIPINGDLKNPNFHLRDVLFDLLENIFVKPPNLQYQYEVRTIQLEVEKSHEFKWEMRQNILDEGQENYVKKVAAFLLKNPEATITLHPKIYTQKEREYILIYEAKKKYYLKVNAIDEKDFSASNAREVERMALKDTLFVDYVTKYCGKRRFNTMQEKCECFLAPGFVNAKLKTLEKNREESFRKYFIDNGTNDRVTFASSQSKVPYNGYSFYEIKYKGPVPESLEEAYNTMKTLNSESPRNKYLKLRNSLE